MTKTKEQINIARIVYDAYPHSDLLPIDPEQDCRTLQTLSAKVTGENIGDSLFRFMVVEIVEGGESTLTGAIRVLEQARADVEAVLQALQDTDADRTTDNCEELCCESCIENGLCPTCREEMENENEEQRTETTSANQNTNPSQPQTNPTEVRLAG